VEKDRNRQTGLCDRAGASRADGAGGALGELAPAGEWVRSFAIVTTTPNELCAELHNRMPVVLKPETWPVWLGEEPVDARQLKTMLAP
jgi:putative SOS response-associated peptidase YedK